MNWLKNLWSVLVALAWVFITLVVIIPILILVGMFGWVLVTFVLPGLLIVAIVVASVIAAMGSCKKGK